MSKLTSRLATVAELITESVKWYDGIAACLFAILVTAGTVSDTYYKEMFRLHPLWYLVSLVIILAGALWRAIGKLDKPTIEFGPVENNSDRVHFHVGVQACNGAIDDCGVTLADSVPRVGHLPLPLHWRHGPETQTMKLSKGNPKQIDLCRFMDAPHGNQYKSGEKVLRLFSVDLPDKAKNEQIDVQSYYFLLSAHGSNCDPVHQWFHLKKDSGDRFKYLLEPAPGPPSPADSAVT